MRKISAPTASSSRRCRTPEARASEADPRNSSLRRRGGRAESAPPAAVLEGPSVRRPRESRQRRRISYGVRLTDSACRLGRLSRAISKRDLTGIVRNTGRLRLAMTIRGDRLETVSAEPARKVSGRVRRFPDTLRGLISRRHLQWGHCNACRDTADRVGDVSDSDHLTGASGFSCLSQNFRRTVGAKGAMTGSFARHFPSGRGRSSESRDETNPAVGRSVRGRCGSRRRRLKMPR